MRVTLFVDNLPTQLTQDELEQFFAACAPVRVILATHRSGRCLGFGFVLFGTQEEADQACRTLDGTMLKGSAVRVCDRIMPDKRVEVA